MIDFKDIISMYNSLYTKESLNFLPEYSVGTNIMYLKWCSREPSAAVLIRPLVDYLFFLKPKHFYYLLACHIPKRGMAPAIKRKTKKTTKKETKLNAIIKKVLKWTDSEFEKQASIINKVILSNSTYWQKEFGLK